MTDATADSAELLEDLREQLRTLGDVLRVLAGGGGLQPVLEEVVEAATRLSHAENGRLWLFKEGRLHVVANCGSTVGLDHDTEHPRIPDRSTMAGRAALTRTLVHLPDVDADPEYTYSGPRPFGSGLHVPIVLEDELIGVIGFTKAEVGPFADEHIELVKTFANQAAIAIANARLLNTTERQLEQQRAISDVLAAVARAEGLDSVLHTLVEAAARLCNAQFGEVYLLEGNMLRFAIGHGGPPELYEYERDHPLPATGDRKSVNGRVLLANEVVQIPDILEDPEFDWPAANEAGVRALLGAPLLVEEELVGVFNLVRTEPVPYTDEQVELVKTFADQAAIALANTRLLEAVERQRTELSRFVSPQVAELVTSGDGERLLAGHRAYITVLFCDMRGFTGVTEVAEPEELFEILREYHRTLGELIPRYEGTLEHFAGDGVMVFFNDPAPVDDHELKAIRLALAAHERFAELAASWSKRGHRLGLGVGISAGYATLGRIGFEGRYDYGALGPVSNLASRLSTRAESGQTLVGQRVLAAVEDHVHATPIGELELKGFREPVPAYAVSGLRGGLSTS